MNTITGSCLLALAFSAVTANPENAWLSNVSAKLPAEEAALVRRAQAALLGNVVVAKPWAPRRGIVPSTGTYHGVWNWDAAFHAVGVSHWDATLAREQVEIILSGQQPNGMLPDVLFEGGRVVVTVTKPPVMAWAAAIIDRRDPRDAWLREVYPRLVKNTEFWLAQRGGRKDGLFFFAGKDAGFECCDDSIRLDNGYRFSKTDSHRLWPPDLNSYMVTHYRALAYMAGRLTLPDEQKKWIKVADALAKRINERLWDDQLGFYVDRDRVTGKDGPALSPAGFVPLFVHIAPPDRAARVAKLAADPLKFFPGMPSVAYDTHGYTSNGYWRGPTWLNWSYFAIKGLKDYGCHELASSMRRTQLEWVAKNGSICEYYDSRTGAGLGARNFGWSSTFTLAFILDWNNDNLTWFFPPVPRQ